MRRLLLVGIHAPPASGSGVERLRAFARLLPSHGWEVTLLTPRPLGCPPRPPDLLGPGTTLLEVPHPGGGGVRERRSDAPTPPWSRLLARLGGWPGLPDPHSGWALLAARSSMRRLRQVRHHAVLASFPPAGAALAGFLVARASGLPLFLDYRDLWSGSPLPIWNRRPRRMPLLGPLLDSLQGPLERQLEAAVRRRSVGVITVSEPMTRWLSAHHHIPARSILTVPNGFDPELAPAFRNAPAPDSGTFVLYYGGGLAGGRTAPFRSFAAAVRALEARDETSPERLRIRLALTSGQVPEDAWGIGAYLERVPPLPSHQAGRYLAGADAALLCTVPGYVERFSFPSKIFDYAMAATPVLAVAVPGGRCDRLLRGLELGRSISAEDPAALEAELLALLSRAWPRPPRPRLDRPPLSGFDRRRGVARLAEFLDRLAAPTERPGSSTHRGRPAGARRHSPAALEGRPPRSSRSARRRPGS